jgi:hypothetical protein
MKWGIIVFIVCYEVSSRLLNNFLIIVVAIRLRGIAGNYVDITYYFVLRLIVLG